MTLTSESSQSTSRRIDNPEPQPINRVLVVDDEINLRKVLTSILERLGYMVVAVSNGNAALAELLNGPFNALITDLRMPLMDGMTLLKQVTATYADLPVIILTAHGSVDNAVTAVKLGAFDYLEKPFDQRGIAEVVSKAIRTNELRRREFCLTGSEPTIGRYGLVGSDPSMRTVYNVIEKVADSPSTVLILGESGTGKELVARALHEQSLRRERPLIKVNCAAIPDSLIESELFGYEKGAFTGATHTKPGRFELADGGTLFLDEIGEISLEMQVKVLRALQESEFERVGGIRTIRVDVRVIAATNSDLIAAIEAGTFREDLYYRLNVVPITVPPLRDRPGDIPILIAHIIKRLRTRLNKDITRMTPEAIGLLSAYHWPGNIRELENVIERCVLFAERDILGVEDLPSLAQATPTQRVNLPSNGPTTNNPTKNNPMTHSSSKEDPSLKEIVRAQTEKIERSAIQAALDETRGNVTHAAKMLQISRKGLQNKMKELGLRTDVLSKASAAKR